MSVGHADAKGDDGHVMANSRNAGFADWYNPIIEHRHFKTLAVENFVFKENHRIRIADGGFQQALRVRCRIGHYHFEAGNL